jgi:hypothetical protein
MRQVGQSNKPAEASPLASNDKARGADEVQAPLR